MFVIGHINETVCVTVVSGSCIAGLAQFKCCHTQKKRNHTKASRDLEHGLGHIYQSCACSIYSVTARIYLNGHCSGAVAIRGAQQCRALMMILQCHRALKCVYVMLSQCPISCTSDICQFLSPVLLYLIYRIFSIILFPSIFILTLHGSLF